MANLDAKAIRHGCPEAPISEPKADVKLTFTNNSNTEYVMEECDMQVSEFNETHADIFKRGLDPNTDKKLVYGVAKSLSPKTALINKMRADIDKANEELVKLHEAELKAQLEAQAKAKADEQAQSSQSTPTPTPTPQGGNQ